MQTLSVTFHANFIVYTSQCTYHVTVTVNTAITNPTVHVNFIVYYFHMYISRAFSGPYEGRGPNGRLADVLFVAFLASGYWAADLGTFDQVANGALVNMHAIVH
jgi:hypothetical protein